MITNRVARVVRKLLAEHSLIVCINGSRYALTKYQVYSIIISWLDQVRFVFPSLEVQVKVVCTLRCLRPLKMKLKLQLTSASNVLKRFLASGKIKHREKLKKAKKNLEP